MHAKHGQGSNAKQLSSLCSSVLNLLIYFTIAFLFVELCLKSSMFSIHFSQSFETRPQLTGHCRGDEAFQFIPELRQQIGGILPHIVCRFKRWHHGNLQPLPTLTREGPKTKHLWSTLKHSFILCLQNNKGVHGGLVPSWCHPVLLHDVSPGSACYSIVSHRELNLFTWPYTYHLCFLILR